VIESFNLLKARIAPSGTFRGNVFTLVSGTMIAQSITILVSPVLTRLYRPDDFGILALFTAIASIVSIAATGRYEMAIMLPEKQEDSVNVTALSIAVVFFVSFLALLVFWVFKGPLSNILNNPGISTWLYAVPLMVLFAGIYQSFNYWSTRNKRFSVPALSRIWQTASVAVASVVLGLATAGAGGLILGSILGQGIAAGVLGWQVWKEDSGKITLIAKSRILESMRRFRDFPRYSLPTALLDNVSVQFPIFILSHAYSPVIVGLFSLAYRIVNIPISIIGSAFAQVFYQKIAELKNNNQNLKKYVMNAALKMFFLSLVPLLTLLLFGPQLFAFLFGETWRTAGVYAQILAPAFAIRFIVSPVSTIFAVTGNLRLGSAWQVLYFFTTTIVLTVASKFDGKVFVLIYTIHELILISLYFSFILRSAKETKCAA
jgi:O-antigen/teichoic acid export membrane protein